MQVSLWSALLLGADLCWATCAHGCPQTCTAFVGFRKRARGSLRPDRAAYPRRARAQVQVSWQQTSGSTSGLGGVVRVIDLREAAPAQQPFTSVPAVFEPVDDSNACCTLCLLRPPRLAGVALLSNVRTVEVYKRVGSRAADEYMGTGKWPLLRASKAQREVSPSRPTECSRSSAAVPASPCVRYLRQLPEVWSLLRLILETGVRRARAATAQVANEWNSDGGRRRYTTELSLPVRAAQH